MRRRIPIGAAAPTLLLLLLAAPIQAQQGRASGDEDVGETIVFARKWADLLEKAPISVTVVSKKTIEDAGIRTIQDASVYVPNLQITEFTARRLSFPFVRGIGSGLGDPAVITYIDGVPQFGFGGTNLPLLDVERIEFLRGPQGTLYGRNSLGGLIHVITERPTAEPQIGATVGYGNFDTQRYSASYSGPTTEGGPLLSASALYTMREGFTDNRFTGNDVDDRDSFFGRGQLLFTPDSRSEIRLTLYGERARDGGFALADISALKADPHIIDQDFEGEVERDVISPTVTWNRYGDSVDFVSITAYQDWDVLETSDFDFTSIDGVRRESEESEHYFYQEVRFSSPEDKPLRVSDDKTLRWLVGASGFYSDSEVSAANDFRPGGAGIFFPPTMVGVDTNSGEFEDLGLGVFGQATLTIDESVELTGGLRFDYEDKEADLRHTFETGGFTVLDEESSFDESFQGLLPKVSIAYHYDEVTTIYASAARGFKAGGFNSSAPAGQTIFDPEKSWTYEAGAKTRWNDGLLGIALAVFYIDWEDMQLSLFDPLAGGYVDNAGESTSKGVDIEFDARLSDQFTAFSTYGLADTEFDAFMDQFGQDASGNSLPFAPRRTWSLGGQYDLELSEDLRWFARAEVQGYDDMFYDAGNLESDSWTLVNLRSGVRKGRWGLDVSVRNAFDEEYIPVALQVNPADPTMFVGENGAPRTVLVTLSLN